MLGGWVDKTLSGKLQLICHDWWVERRKASLGESEKAKTDLNLKCPAEELNFILRAFIAEFPYFENTLMENK